MYTYPYPRPAVTADIVLIDTALRRLLLIRRKNDPYKGSWAFPGGFFDMEDDDIEQTAARELEEETGLTDLTLTLGCIASAKGRDPRARTISAIYYACVDSSHLSAKGGDDAEEAQWFSLDHLPALAFDHASVLEKIRNTINI